MLFAEFREAVVGDDAALASEGALAVVAAFASEAGGEVLEEAGIEGGNVDLVEFAVPAEHVDEVGGILEMGHGSGEADVFAGFEEVPVCHWRRWRRGRWRLGRILCGGSGWHGYRCICVPARS